MKHILKFIIGLFLLASCESQQKVKELEQKIKVLEYQLQVKQIHITSLTQRLEEFENQRNGAFEKSQLNNNLNYSTTENQYYFIVLEIIEDRTFDKQEFYYTTQVNQIKIYNESIKYQLLDEVVSDYKNSARGSVYNGTVKNRNIYLFNSYENASKAREKYIMNK